VFIMAGYRGLVTERDLLADPADVAVYSADVADQLGASFGVSDVNEDGRDDLLVPAALSASLANGRGHNAGEVHLILGRPLSAGCSIVPDAGPPVFICPGTSTTLSAAASQPMSCPTSPEYRWAIGASVIRDWSTDPKVTVQPAASTTYRVDLRCGNQTIHCTGSASVAASVLRDDVPGDQGNVLRAARRGIDVELSFPGAPATLWRIYRDADRTSLGSSALTPDVSSRSFTDGGAAPALPALGFYRVKGLSPCSFTPGP
jgi:hypothetical protein